ncbi:MAG: FAD-binding oxidoreductase [Verrucomicrobia bacterium]|nr:FAD-binding oxidoreductase [Verrucomicrobiota bacterium]
MVLKPSNLDDLCATLAGACSRGEKITSIQLGALNQIVEHSADDMVAIAEAGITVADFQDRLAQRKQWLPIDPPNPDQLTIRELLSSNRSGPRRFGYGTIRDYVIGLKAVLADGRLVKSGGKVVKNVAGYDLAKLFVGSRDSLGIIVEAAFKLHPLPEAEVFAEAKCPSLEEADQLIEKILASDLTPTVLDLHNLEARTTNTVSEIPGQNRSYTLVLGFAGTREDVECQLAIAREFGIDLPSSLAYEVAFWRSADSYSRSSSSVLPSALVQTLRELGEDAFVARAGNGIIWHREKPQAFRGDWRPRLTEQIKRTFDPNNTLPELSS